MPIFSADPLFHLAMSVVLGGALGFFGGLFGIGGGVIAIPLFVLAFGMEQPVAQGTALVMMVPNLLVGWWRYSRRHPVPLKRALAIGLTAAATTWATARLATGLPPEVLRSLFAGFLMVLAVHMLVRHRAAAGAPRFAERWVPLVGLAGGTSMGLLGIGGGLVATPLLTAGFGLSQTVAQSLSLALVAPASVVALSTYAGAGRVDWALGLPMAAAGMASVAAGVAVAHRLPEKRLRAGFAWMLLFTSAWLLAGPVLR